MPPISQKLIVAVAIFLVFLGGIGAGIYAQTNSNAETQAAIEAIDAEIKGYEDIIKTKAAMQKQRDQQEDVFKELVSILPLYSERQEERILEFLTSYASLSKLSYKGHTFTTRKANPAPAAPGAPPPPPPPPGPGAAAGDFTQHEIAARYEGTFFNFVKFLSHVENHESFLKVEGFSLTPQPWGEGPQPENRMCTINVRLSTYAYANK